MEILTGTIYSFNDGIDINGQIYEWSFAYDNFFTKYNENILLNSEIEVELDGNKITKIKSLILKQPGILQGNDQSIETLYIDSFGVHVKDLIVSKGVYAHSFGTENLNLENVTTKELHLKESHSFQVRTLLPKTNRLELNAVKIEEVNVGKSDLNIEITSTSEINEIKIDSNAVKLSNITGIINRVEVIGEVDETVLEGQYNLVKLSLSNDYNLKGSGIFNEITITTEPTMNLDIVGQLNNLRTTQKNVVLGSNLKLQKTFLNDAQISAAEIIINYDQVSNNIGQLPSPNESNLFNTNYQTRLDIRKLKEGIVYLSFLDLNEKGINLIQSDYIDVMMDTLSQKDFGENNISFKLLPTNQIEITFKNQDNQLVNPLESNHKNTIFANLIIGDDLAKRTIFFSLWYDFKINEWKVTTHSYFIHQKEVEELLTK